MIPKRRDNKEEDGHQARAVKGKGMLRKLSDSNIVPFLHFLSCSLSLSVFFSNICSFSSRTFKNHMIYVCHQQHM
jgi:hypothetical protein